MIDRLIHALVESDNQAADDLLLEALRLGTEPEQRVVLDALLQRQSSRGLGGVIARYDQLPEALQSHVLANLRAFHHVLAECGRSGFGTFPARTSFNAKGMSLIALTAPTVSGTRLVSSR